MTLSSFFRALEFPIPESSGWQMTGSHVSSPTSGWAPSLLNQFIVCVPCCVFRGQRAILRSESSHLSIGFGLKTPVARLA